MQIKSSYFTNPKTLLGACLLTAVVGMVTINNKKSDNVNVKNQTENKDNKIKQTDDNKNTTTQKIDYAGYIDYWNIRK